MSISFIDDDGADWAKKFTCGFAEEEATEGRDVFVGDMAAMKARDTESSSRRVRKVFVKVLAGKTKC